jgi:hypothetical protein
VVAKSRISRRRKLLCWLAVDAAVAAVVVTFLVYKPLCWLAVAVAVVLVIAALLMSRSLSLAIEVALLAVVVALLLYRPSLYNPVQPATANDPNGQVVHPYLHRDLGSTFYNNVQKQRPFEMSVVDRSLNEAIADKKWQSEGVALSAPQIFFVPGQVLLMGTADFEGARLVVTVELTPQIDGQGRLALVLQKFKVGAMNVTPLARMMGRKMYQEQLDSGSVDLDNLGTKIVAALLNEEPFDPVVEVDDKRVRLTGVDIAQSQLTARFAPVKTPK